MGVTGPLRSPQAVAMLVRSGVPVVEIADLPDRPIGSAIGFSNHHVGRAAAHAHHVANGGV